MGQNEAIPDIQRWRFQVDHLHLRYNHHTQVYANEKNDDMKYYAYILLLCLLGLSCEDRIDDSARTEELIEQLEAAQAEIENQRTAAATSPGLIHQVFVWLQDDLSAAEEAAFVEGMRSLTEVPSVRSIYLGRVAPTEARAVVDNTYDYSLLLHFDDIEGQNAYQVDPIHKKFLEEHRTKWTKVVVYDSMPVE